MEKQLPKNWNLVSLEKLGENKYYAIGDGDHGQIKPSDYKDSGIPYIRVGDLDWGFFKEDKLVYISEEVHNKNLKSELLPGDILIAKTGATIGKCCIVPNHIKKANTTSSVGKISINKDLTSSKWILYYFLSPDFFKLMWSHSHRTAQPGFNIIDIKNFPVPLPTLTEQNRIVTKLDTLFAQLETIKISMANVPLLLKDFRQQVLTQAVTGKLTEEFKYSNILNEIIEDKTNWYNSQLIYSLKNKSKKPRKQVTEFSGDKDYLKEFLVKKIDIAFFDEISAKKENALKAGPFGSSLKKEFYVEKGYKIYGQEQVINDNPFYGNYYINEEKFKELQSCEVQENDLLISLVGTIGKVLIIPKGFEKGIINPRLVKLSLHEKVNPKFIKIFLQSSIVKDFLKENSHGGTMDVLNLGIIKSLPIPLPSIEEQQEIVSRVESLFAKADAIEKQYESLKAKIDNLPQALLHKAFKGELTEQLASDGDARELLKEIEALKATTGKTIKGGKVVKKYEDKDEVLGMVAEPKDELQSKVVKLKPSNTEIYKRTLLAAEIVYQLKDTNTLGHLKLQKMLYLCQEIGSMNLPMKFLKQAMGPYDNQLARSLDKQFILKKWFEYQNGALLKYKPLENCGKHKDDFIKFFENEIEQINYLINKFTKFTSNQIEAVATLYACWKEAIEQKELITDKLIITKFYQWSKEKEKFREENLIKALGWMRRNGVEPR